MTDEKIAFSKSWLSLRKQEFRIMALLADVGEFKGNLSDMCRYFSLDPQQRNRNNLRQSIQLLSEQNFITSSQSKRIFTLNVSPKGKETEILISRKWLQTLRAHNYTSESVSWEAVLKVFLWISDNKTEVVTNNMIAADLNVSISTVVCAKNVLEKEYEIITKRKVSEKLGENYFRTLGQELHTSAWWTEP